MICVVTLYPKLQNGTLAFAVYCLVYIDFVLNEQGKGIDRRGLSAGQAYVMVNSERRGRGKLVFDTSFWIMPVGAFRVKVLGVSSAALGRSET